MSDDDTHCLADDDDVELPSPWGTRQDDSMSIDSDSHDDAAAGTGACNTSLDVVSSVPSPVDSADDFDIEASLPPQLEGDDDDDDDEYGSNNDAKESPRCQS